MEKTHPEGVRPGRRKLLDKELKINTHHHALLASDSDVQVTLPINYLRFSTMSPISTISPIGIHRQCAKRPWTFTTCYCYSIFVNVQFLKLDRDSFTQQIGFAYIYDAKDTPCVFRWDCDIKSHWPWQNINIGQAGDENVWHSTGFAWSTPQM